MKLKNLLLTFIAVLMSAGSTVAATVQETISYTNIDTVPFNSAHTVHNSTSYTVSNADPHATYRVFVGTDDTNQAIKFKNNEYIATLGESNGYIQNISITWSASTPNAGEIHIYAKNDAYATSNNTNNNNKGTEVATFTYTGNTTSSQTVTGKYQHLMITGANAPLIESITITWSTITTYTIGATNDFDYSKGTIDFSTTSVATGGTVEIYLQGAEDDESGDMYELAGYIINGVRTEFAEKDYTLNQYTITIKNVTENILVNGIWRMYLPREDNRSIVTGTGVDESKKTITITSGETVSFQVRTVYPTTELSMVAGGADFVELKNGTFTNQTGSFKLTAYNQTTTAKLTLTTTQTNEYAKTLTTYTIKVVPRNVMLVAEYDGHYYAAVNTLTSGRLVAQEVSIENETVIIAPTATYKESNLLWKVCSKNPATTNKNKEEFTIQTPGGSYLNISTDGVAEFEYANGHAWFKNEERFNYSGNGIVYYADIQKFAPLNLLTNPQGAKEYGKYATATIETLRSGLTIDAFSTTCQPYSFIAAEGVELYEIDNIENNHIYFCRLDAGEITTAGQPYIIKSQTTEAKAYKIGDEGAAAGTHNGLYGVDENTTWNSLWTTQSSLFYNGNVMVFKKDGSIAHVEYDTAIGGGGGIAGHSACILLSEVNHGSSTCSPADSGAAPRRVALAVEESQVPTAVENTLNATNINWNEPVYNIMGQRVARGTTGVLIQNGQKFIAE